VRTRALSVALLILVLSLAGASPATAASPGKLNFTKTAEANFDPYTRAPSAAQQAEMRDRYARMRTFSPYFDSRLSWFPNAWSYQDAYAVYASEQSSLDPYILRDGSGNRLFIDYGCSAGTCPLYAADIGDPGWRRRYIDRAKEKVALGYKGLFVDDVNLDFRVSNGYGNFVAPVDERTGQAMTEEDWQRYMAEFMEQLRAELPADFEIVHNQVYFFAGGTSNPYVRRAIEAASHINIERGVIDPGIVGGSGPFGYETVLAWVEYAHSRGKGVVWDAASTWGREYAMATHFLTANGLDFFQHGAGANPDGWWTGYETNLGEPLGERYSWSGVLRRDFERGIVLVNQPGQSTKSLGLGDNFKTMDGAWVSSVTLPTREGLVLQRSEPRAGNDDKAAGRPTRSSSSYSGDFESNRATDDNPATRWSSAFSDGEWWEVDLGSVRRVDAVEIHWERAYAENYKILTSTDGTNFVERADVTISAPGLERTNFEVADARYVRLVGVSRATQWGFSFWDLRVFGPSDDT
jgi:hypothetical protein